MIKKITSVFALCILTIVFASCDLKQYRPSAVGTFGEVIVVMDSTEYQGPVAEAIRSVFGENIYTIPGAPDFMDVRFRSFSTESQLDQLKKFKNIIIAAPLDGQSNTAGLVRALLGENAKQQVEAGNNFSFIIQDEWYKNQWLLILTAPDAETLTSKIQSDSEELTHSLLQKEFQRWRDRVYKNSEKKNVEEYLWTNYGWKIRVKHDWSPHLDTTYTQGGSNNHLFTMQRITQKNDRRFWAWWQNKSIDVDTLTNNGINALRDKIWQKWFRGDRSGAYIATSFRRPVVTDTLTIGGHPAYETLGVWRMKGDVMAGPFASILVYDKRTERLFMVGFLQFAPSVKEKKPYVRQFRAMLRTFKTDPDFEAEEQGED
ncbi:MAG TPA: DUF4837 family protein [Balneolaceae bacterium]|nr:DUF4837 family protein [Balneolaceae bacterium]